VLRMSSVAANQLERPIGHESCLQIAARFACVPAQMLRRQKTIASATGPFGKGSGRWGKDYLSVWYCCRQAGLIIGVYAFPVTLFYEPEQQEAMGECAHMVAQALFDRTAWAAWGANDELTKFLVAQQEAQQQLHLYQSDEVLPQNEGYSPA
jgi:hypothetical protein